MEIDGLSSWVGRLVAEAPLLERLIMASLELVLTASVVYVFDRLLRQHRPRVVALLWMAVMANTVFSVVFHAPLSITVYTLPISEQAVSTGSGEASGSGFWREAENGGFQGGLFMDTGPSYRVGSLQQVASWQGMLVEVLQAVKTRPGYVFTNAWLSGVWVFVLLALRDRFRLWRLVHHGAVAPAVVHQELSMIAGELRMRYVPRLAVCRTLDSPAIAGAYRPVILIPEWMLAEEVGPQLRWALRHELMHAHMGDPAMNTLSQLTRILFFFHPMAWWVSRRWKVAMELACDHALLQSEADVRDYLDMLRTMLSGIQTRRKLRLSCGLFAVRSQLGQRVAALVRMPLHERGSSRVPVAAVLCFAFLALCTGGHVAPTALAHDARVWPVRELMRFPEDRSMGMLYVQPMGSMDETAWEPWGEAQGVLDVPDGVLVRLELPRQAMKDLTPLDALGRYDLQSILLAGRPDSWSVLSHLDRLSFWELKFRPKLGYGGSGNNALGDSVPQPDGVLQFAEDHSSGYVYVSALSQWGSPENWQPWQEAEGAVTVPREGYVVRLELSNEAMSDLSPLAALGQHDLQSISFRHKPRSWAELAYLDGLMFWELEYHASLGYGGSVPVD